MTKIINVEGLKKSYGKINAVKGIDFYVESGKLFSFLGPNGAGKSTTIDILCTLMAPSSGRVTIDGHTLGKEDDAIRQKIGAVFQDSVLDPLLTVQENLKVRARFYGLSGNKLNASIKNATGATDIADLLDRQYGNLSGGQRRRVDIARALINTPKILFLDEPTTGLDPKTKEDVWQTLTALQRNTGLTVFLTTHYMEEAAVSDYIILINKGKIAAKGTPYDLRKEYSSDTLRIKPKSPSDTKRILDNSGMSYTDKNGLLIAGIDQTMEAIPLINELAPFMESFEVIHGSMDDVFLNITGGELAYV